MKWEYMVWAVSQPGSSVHGEGGFVTTVDGKWMPVNSKPLLTALRRAGEDGWELAGTISASSGQSSALLFKRPLAD